MRGNPASVGDGGVALRRRGQIDGATFEACAKREGPCHCRSVGHVNPMRKWCTDLREKIEMVYNRVTASGHQ